MKKYIKSISLLLIYFYFVYGFSLVCKYGFNIKLTSSNISHLFWVNFIADIVFVVAGVLLSLDVLSKKNDKKEPFGKVFLKNALIIFLGFLVFFGIKMEISVIVTLICKLLHCSITSNNQELVEQLIHYYPIGTFISTVIFAPIAEELIFRGAIRRLIDNKVLFVIISGLVFGLVHVMNYRIPIFIIIFTGILLDMILSSKLNNKKKIITSIGTVFGMLIVCLIGMHVAYGGLNFLFMSIELSEVVGSIMYIVMGGCLALSYVLFDNIYINMGIHSLNNLVSFILVFT